MTGTTRRPLSRRLSVTAAVAALAACGATMIAPTGGTTTALWYDEMQLSLGRVTSSDEFVDNITSKDRTGATVPEMGNGNNTNLMFALVADATMSLAIADDEYVVVELALPDRKHIDVLDKKGAPDFDQWWTHTSGTFMAGDAILQPDVDGIPVWRPEDYTAKETAKASAWGFELGDLFSQDGTTTITVAVAVKDGYAPSGDKNLVLVDRDSNGVSSLNLRFGILNFPLNGSNGDRIEGGAKIKFDDFAYTISRHRVGETARESGSGSLAGFELTAENGQQPSHATLSRGQNGTPKKAATTYFQDCDWEGATACVADEVRVERQGGAAPGSPLSEQVVAESPDASRSPDEVADEEADRGALEPDLEPERADRTEGPELDETAGLDLNQETGEHLEMDEEAGQLTPIDPEPAKPKDPVEPPPLPAPFDPEEGD